MATAVERLTELLDVKEQELAEAKGKCKRLECELKDSKARAERLAEALRESEARVERSRSSEGVRSPSGRSWSGRLCECSRPLPDYATGLHCRGCGRLRFPPP
jgi:predicted RecB family endonuclease